MTEIFIPHPLDGKWAVRDQRTDELLRGCRSGLTRLIWRGTELEALSLCRLLNSGVQDAPPEELTRSQKIHFANVARRKRSTGERAVIKSSFKKCAGCDKMVKEGHTCTPAKE